MRPVKAWAVVCASGKIHDPFSLERTGIWARMLVTQIEKGTGLREACGPHTVVPLTGTFAPKKGKAKR
jgi:hypothetical protein